MCGTSGILPVSQREQNEVDDFSKSTNRDSSNVQSISAQRKRLALLLKWILMGEKIIIMNNKK